jgi:hypothetical protein
MTKKLLVAAVALASLATLTTPADAYWVGRYRQPWWNTGPRIVGPLISTPQPYFPVPRVGPPIYGPTAGVVGGPIQAPLYAAPGYAPGYAPGPNYAPPPSAAVIAGAVARFLFQLGL